MMAQLGAGPWAARSQHWDWRRGDRGRPPTWGGTPIIFNQHTPFLQREIQEMQKIHFLQNTEKRRFENMGPTSDLMGTAITIFKQNTHHTSFHFSSNTFAFINSTGQHPTFPSDTTPFPLFSNNFFPPSLNWILLTLICQYCNYCQGKIRFLHFHQFPSAEVRCQSRSTFQAGGGNLANQTQ